jgi:polar amino acid transport system substrate-binding protein
MTFEFRSAAMRLLKASLMLTAFVIMLMEGRAVAQTPDTFDRIVREKKIRFGYIISPPGAIRDPASGGISGFYIDGARGIAELMKVEPSFVETTWSTFAAGLQAGQFDVSIAATFATIPRAMAVAFTNPIHYQSFSGVARKGEDRFKVMADLDKPELKIAVVQGSAGHEFVLQNLKKAQVTALSTSNLQQPFLEVSAGRADIAIQDESQVRRYVPTHPEVVALFGGNPFNTLPLAWAVRRGDQNLLNFMNTAINFMLSSGRWEQYAMKYKNIGRYKVTPNLTPFGNF